MTEEVFAVQWVDDDGEQVIVGVFPTFYDAKAVGDELKQRNPERVFLLCPGEIVRRGVDVEEFCDMWERLWM
jgi:hypothetical protein